MRRSTTIVTILAALISAAATAQTGDVVRSISVSGTAETEVAPDMIVWTAQLYDTDASSQAAKNKSDEKVMRILALRETLGIADSWL